MAHDPLYGSEVDDNVTGFFPTPEIGGQFMNGATADRAPVVNNDDIHAARYEQDGKRDPEKDDRLDPNLIDEYEHFRPLNDLSQINDRKIVLPPPPKI